MESLDGKPPQWTVRKESVGGHKRYWVVRRCGKLFSVFDRKSDAHAWVYNRERNGGYK